MCKRRFYLCYCTLPFSLLMDFDSFFSSSTFFFDHHSSSCPSIIGCAELLPLVVSDEIVCTHHFTHCLVSQAVHTQIHHRGDFFAFFFFIFHSFIHSSPTIVTEARAVPAEAHVRLRLCLYMWITRAWLYLSHLCLHW